MRTKMNYEIVNLEEKTIVGITARTRNSDANMGQVIGGLWGSFFGEGVYSSIENKVNTYTVGLYSDYESDVNSEYSITVGCEVMSAANQPQNTAVKTIKKGKYAKFTVHGHMQKAVAEFWQKLWAMDLDRTYQSDFEEYINADEDNAEINIYISL